MIDKKTPYEPFQTKAPSRQGKWVYSHLQTTRCTKES